MSELGRYLKEVRLSLEMSLRDVEASSGVSNAYLSMIESGKRKDPHPNILRSLSEVYRISQARLMKLAGYLDLEAEEQHDIEVMDLYGRAMADEKFTFGTRYRGEPTQEMREFIAMMYRRFLEERTG